MPIDGIGIGGEGHQYAVDGACAAASPPPIPGVVFIDVAEKTAPVFLNHALEKLRRKTLRHQMLASQLLHALGGKADGAAGPHHSFADGCRDESTRLKPPAQPA